MPNIKSAQKRLELSELAREKHRAERSRLRTALKRMRETTDPAQADARLREAVALLDKAAKSRLIHPNRASRLKGQMARHLNALSAQA
jgi:small subunit ribosomal protein S20